MYQLERMRHLLCCVSTGSYILCVSLYLLPCLRQGLFCCLLLLILASWHMSFWGFSCLCFLLIVAALGLQMCAPSGFTWILEIATLILMLAWEARYSLSHLTSTKAASYG